MKEFTVVYVYERGKRVEHVKAKNPDDADRIVYLKIKRQDKINPLPHGRSHWVCPLRTLIFTGHVDVLKDY